MNPKAGRAFRRPARSETSLNVPSPLPRKSAFCDPVRPCGPHITLEPFPEAVAAAARRVAGRVVVVDVADDEQVEMAVAIEVEEGRIPYSIAGWRAAARSRA